MPVLSLAGCYDKCRYAWLIRPCITRDVRVSSLVVDSEPCYHPLRQKFNVYSDVSHTHTPHRGGEEKLRSRP